MAAPPAREEPRYVQVMAELLTPFAGRHAPALADTLKREFGSLGRALAAPSNQLIRAGHRFGPACELLVAARRLVEEAHREIAVGAHVDPAEPALISYLQDRLCRTTRETMLVIFCDANDRYLDEEEMGWGAQDSIRLDSSQLFRRAFKLDASAVLLAHNHPSGVCEPSSDDITATRQLATMGDSLGLQFLDHLIVTDDQAYSMRAGKHL
ncbi:MAG: JAB domain-containing protein [Pontixanthobacter sp.]